VSDDNAQHAQWRHVHAVLEDGSEIVRYTDGVWGRVYPNHRYIPWERLTATKAARLAADAPTLNLGLPHGSWFDHEVTRVRMERGLE
jgi:hypothetical protein